MRHSDANFSAAAKWQEHGSGSQLKQQIKQGQSWDEPTRRSSFVEIIVGDNHLLADEENVVDAGIAADAGVSVVLR